jgi:hypothetical protein
MLVITLNVFVERMGASTTTGSNRNNTLRALKDAKEAGVTPPLGTNTRFSIEGKGSLLTQTSWNVELV